ncbi:MAG: 16S rRNA (cytidine(1402)-2'-O)-methyltransferase [Thermoanaerobaculia bacterium]
MAGRLLLIGTPIGNLGDLSPRAREAMQRVSLLLCEDTRHTGKLLEHFGIDVPLESHHEHNESEKLEAILARLEGGETLGIVSDAGMPLLSDPGFPLVREARRRGIVVEPIPGPFAAAVAVSASGLPPMPFAFYGFAPHRKNQRIEFYREIAGKKMTAAVYESPHRIVASLEDALEGMGDVEMTLAREMTKLHEELIHGSVSTVLEAIRGRDALRGEITLVFAPAREVETAAIDPAVLKEEFRKLRDEGMRRGDAIRILAERHGLRKNELYQALLQE